MGWCRCFCVRWRSPIVGMVRTTVSTLCILVSSIQGFVLHEYHRPLGNVAAEVRLGAKSLRLEPSPSQRRRSGTTSSFSSGPMCRWGSGSTKMMMLDWESIVYNTESVANDMAGLSLQDPSNLVTSLPIMYGAGLLTSVSPCVWGLLPLTISYISTGAAERQDQKTTLPTLAFAAGLAVVFCTLGVTAAQLGEVFGAAESNNSGSGGSGIALLPLFSNSICFAMGLQLLGLVNLPLPSLDGILKSPGSGSLQPFRAGSSSEKELILIDGSGQILSNNQDAAGSNDKNNGSLFRTFLLGGSSALVASPCATPVLTSILAFVAKAQNPALGPFYYWATPSGIRRPS